MFPPSAPHPSLFLSRQPWFARLKPDMQARLQQECTVQTGDKGALLLPAGEPSTGWHAVLQGLVKLQSKSRNGRASVYLGVPAGEWFGEGSVLKNEPRRYEVVALRQTQLLCMPRELFECLRLNSLSFNQHLVTHLNMRLGQAMAAVEAGRIRSPEQRVAITLSRLFWKGASRVDLTQDEIGQLSGLSRQTVNRALQKLEAMALLDLQFSRVRITDDAGLHTFLSQPDGGSP